MDGGAEDNCDRDEGVKSQAEELKDKFEQQQEMIGQLREAISKNADKGVEDYALRLAKMKPRLLKGRSRGKRSADPNLPTSEDKSTKMKQEEEIEKAAKEFQEVPDTSKQDFQHSTVEYKIEQKELKIKDTSSSSIPNITVSENVGNNSMKEVKAKQTDSSKGKIHLLRKQLEENRTKFERQQRENADKRAAMEDMKDRIEKLRIEVEERDNVIQSLQTETADPDIRHLYQQILHKDNVIMNLSENINELEISHQDRIEEINEKNKIIEARTEAVGLVAKDRDEKIHATVEELDCLRQEMQRLQKDFMQNESSWQNEQKIFQNQLTEKESKISALEENSKRNESVRFQLSTRNAEIQDKVVRLQTAASDMALKLKDFESTVAEKDVTISELQKKLSRAEAFGVKKLNKFEKYFKSVEKDELGERILMLSNDIALLEEEKGNLQLKLVDYDDLKCIHNNLIDEKKQLDVNMSKCNEELNSTNSIVSDLEKENILFVEKLNKMNLENNELNEKLNVNLKELEEIKQNNISLNIQICSLEEERDIAVKKLHSSDEGKNDYETLLKEKESLLSIASEKSNELSLLKEKCEGLTAEHGRLKLIADKAVEEKDEFNQQNNSLLELLTQHEQTILSQNWDISSKSEAISSHSAEISALKEKLSKISSELHSISEELFVKTEEYNSQRLLLNNITAKHEEETLILKTQIENLSEEQLNLKSSGVSLEEDIKDKDKLIIEYDTKLCQVTEEAVKISRQFAQCKEDLCKNLAELETIKEELESTKSQYASIFIELEHLKEEKSKEKNNLEDNSRKLEAEMNIMEGILKDRENTVKMLEGDIQTKVQEIVNNQLMISNFEQENCDNYRIIDDLKINNAALHAEISQMSTSLEHVNEANQSYSKEIKDLKNTLVEEETIINNMQTEFDSLSSRCTELESSLQENQQKYFEIERLNEDLKTKLTYSEEKLKNMEERLGYAEQGLHIASAVESENKTSLQSLKSHYEYEVGNFKKIVEEKDSIVSELQQRTEIQRLNTDEKDQRLKTLEEQFSNEKVIAEEKVYQFSVLQQQYQNEKLHLEESNKKLSILEEHLQQEKLQSEESTKKLSLLEQQIEMEKRLSEEKDYKLSVMEQQIHNDRTQSESSINSLLNEKAEEVITLSNSIVSFRTEIDKKQLEIECLQSEKGDFEVQLHQTSVQLNEVTNLLGQKKAELSTVLEQQIKDGNKAHSDSFLVESLKGQVGSLEEELNCTRTNLQADIASKITEINHYGVELKARDEMLQERLKEIEDLNIKYSQKETELSQTVVDQNLVISVDNSMEQKYAQLEKEKESLETELAESQKAVILLQTSLATQSPTVKEDEWGNVDLGSPDSFDLKHFSEQTALLEKDKILAVTQEQLKEALEQVNSITNEKKLLDHQMKTLESELGHKDRKLKSLEENNLSFQTRVSEMNMNIEKLQNDLLNAKQAYDTLSSSSANLEIVQPQQEELEDANENTTSDQPSQSDQILADMQYKLTWYEEQWPMWTESYNQLQAAYDSAQQKILELQNVSSGVIETSNNPEQYQSASVLFESPKESSENTEAKLNSLQEKFNEFINKYNIQDQNCIEYQAECQRLQALNTELQNTMQDSAVKTARVSELELMVESAESEISRLRTEFETLTSAGNSLETERSCLKEEITNLKEELRKNNTERERISAENDKLQQQIAVQLSSGTEHEQLRLRLQSENDQLRSELEVLEGDIDRIRSAYEVMEGECNRQRAEIDIINQNNQILQAEKESISNEMDRLTAQIQTLISEKNQLVQENHKIFNDIQTLSAERDHLRQETHRLFEVKTSAESEISRLKSHIENIGDVANKYQELEANYTELQGKFSQMEMNVQKIEIEEEIDWQTEAASEQLQQSSASEEQINTLKEKLIELEKERNSLSDELYAIKLKNGKLLQRVKLANSKNENLQKEIENLKKFSGLDVAIEDEYKSQISKVEKERDEFKIKIDEMEKEKTSLKGQLDVLHSAQDKYVDLNETQDLSLKQSEEEKKVLESKVFTMEWRISELEEALEQKSSTQPRTPSEIRQEDKQLDELGTQSVGNINRKIEELCEMNKNLNIEIENYKHENTELKVINEKLQKQTELLESAKQKLENDCKTYKKSYMELYNEHEALKSTDVKSKDQYEIVNREFETLKLSYDSIYCDYNVLQDQRDLLKYELGIMSGEKEKIEEELSSVNNQLSALQEEEQESIILALQEECANQRNDNNELKDEIIRINENIRQAEEEAERVKNSMEKQLDIQELLRNELNEKILEINYLNLSRSSQEKDLKYEKAEIAALKSQVQRYQELHEESQKELADLKTGSNVVESKDKGDVDSAVHLRDLRCQQLSIEINKLIEERDSLQLKLSASLRHNQELGRELVMSQHLPSPSPPNSLQEKLEELRELNSSMERRASASIFPPSLPTFTPQTVPATPTASRQTEYSSNQTNPDPSPPTLAYWIFGKRATEEILHV